VRQIELAVDDRPSFGIDRILVRCRVVRRTHRAVAVILRRVAVRILGEQIAMLAVGKTPAQFVPQIFEIGLALHGFAIGEISHRVVATDREFWFVAPGRISNGRHHQSAEQGRALPQSQKRSPPHVRSPRGRNRVQRFPWPADAASNIVLLVCGEVKRIRDARPA
jgi:hypothetical protein